MLVAITILVVGALYVLMFGDVHHIRSKPVAQSFAQDIKAGDMDKAYALLSPGLQQNLSKDAFTANMKQNFSGYSNATISLDAIKGSDGFLTYAATLYVTDGQTPVRKMLLKMVETSRHWQIGAIKLEN